MPQRASLTSFAFRNTAYRHRVPNILPTIPDLPLPKIPNIQALLFYNFTVSQYTEFTWLGILPARTSYLRANFTAWRSFW